MLLVVLICEYGIFIISLRLLYSALSADTAAVSGNDGGVVCDDDLEDGGRV